MSRGPIVVVGDALLDRDLVGTATRLAPDAPAPVVDLEASHDRPGGAALAALLTARDGHDVVLVTAVGDDAAGRRLRELLAPHLTLVALPLCGGTPVKTRVRVEGRSMLRLDEGDGRPMDAPTDLSHVLADASALLVSDYGRGVTDLPGVRAALEAAAARTPVVWDPHPRGGRPVSGVRLATPNAAEARTFAGGDDGDTLRAVAKRAARLAGEWSAAAVSVTIGNRGAVVSYGGGTPLVVPAPTVRGDDPCGAGDRYAAAAAVALAGGALPTEAVVAAVRSASAFVAAGGASGLLRGADGPATRGDDAVGVVERVRAQGGTVVATGGCFDLLHAGHVGMLEAARRLGDCLVVCLNSDASVRRLKGSGRPLVGQDDRSRVLGALGCVDAVAVFDEDTPVPLLERLRPDVWVKGGDYVEDDLPEAAVVRSWGGEVALVPYLDGRSTSRLVESVTARHLVGDGRT